MQSQTLLGLQDRFSDVEFIPIASSIRNVRRYKTDFEVNMLMQSARINEMAIYDSIKGINAGLTEIDIAKKFNQSLVNQGAIPSLTMIKAGRAAVGGQRRQRDDILLQEGDILWFDSDAIYNGYWSDIARVYAVGKVSTLQMKRYQALRNGMMAAYSYIRPGRTGKQIFTHVMDTIHRSGFPEYRRHHVGHAIGVEPYELPILGPHDHNYVEEGMILSVETPYYEFGIGALHIEDPLYIGSGSNKFLTLNPVPELHIL